MFIKPSAERCFRCGCPRSFLKFPNIWKRNGKMFIASFSVFNRCAGFRCQENWIPVLVRTTFTKVRMVLQLLPLQCLIWMDKFLRASTEHFDHQHGITNRSCSFFRLLLLLSVRFIGYGGVLRRDFQLLPFRKYLRVNRKNRHDVFTSTACSGLRVLTEQELLAALLARAL